MTSNKEKKEQITTSSLSVTYFPGQSNEVKSLDNINLSICEGEFVIFFGPSGCGKSTLLYAIADLEKYQGDVVVDGRKIKDLNRKEKIAYSRNTVGMVFQAFHLIPTLNVMQNVALPLISAGVLPKERKKRVMELLTRFGVQNQAYRLPSQLSGGQQQRVAICRAVINDPKILLADEPLGNLDSKSANEVIKLFKDINIRLGKTVILVTHDPTFLDIAHRVFFIKDGKIIDVKVNENVRTEICSEEEQNKFPATSHSKELDFISNHYSKLKANEPDFLMRAFKAKNLATMALADLTVDDFDSFRDIVEKSLRLDDNFAMVEKFLDVNPEKGGLGLDSRTAKKITGKLRLLAKELQAGDNLPIINTISGRDRKTEQQEENEVIALRRALFDELNIELSDYNSLGVIDSAILQRVRGEIDSKALFLLLDKPLKEGGAGLDKRVASKMSKRLEVWLIGHKE